jgi:hypothetical protein
MRPVPAARPAHAGSLVPWDRLAFAVLFAVMAAFIVMVVVLSAHSRGHGRPSGGQAGAAGHGGRSRQALAGGTASSAAWNRRLAAALAPVLRGRDGRLAVGVIDRSTGVTAVFGAQSRFRAAGIVRAEILAALRLKNDGQGTAGGRADDLATRMIEAGDSTVTTRLWRQAGGAAGLAAAGKTLGLRQTTPGPADSWGQTTTTAGDQLALLTDLTSATSPLPAAARAYEIGLLSHVSAGQQWGVPAAASPGSSYAVVVGSRAWGAPRRWAVNSIGMVERGGHQLLLAILSDGQPSAAAGMAEDRAAAVAAAGCLTSGG